MQTNHCSSPLVSAVRSACYPCSSYAGRSSTATIILVSDLPQHHLNASASTAISSSCTPSIPPLLLFSCVTFHCCSLTSCLTGLTSQHASSQAANTHCASASKVLNGHCTTSSSSGIPRVRAMYGILPLHPPSMSDMMRKEFPHAHHRI